MSGPSVHTARSPAGRSLKISQRGAAITGSGGVAQPLEPLQPTSSSPAGSSSAPGKSPASSFSFESLQHPGLPGLLEQDGAAPVAAFAPMEVTLQALQSRGTTELDRARIFFLLVGFTLSQASYQARAIPALEPSEEVRTERIAGRGYKTIERLEVPATWDFDASFAFGISLILNGVEATVSTN